MGERFRKRKESPQKCEKKSTSNLSYLLPFLSELWKGEWQ
jgi:hypothetical protein